MKNTIIVILSVMTLILNGCGGITPIPPTITPTRTPEPTSTLSSVVSSSPISNFSCDETKSAVINTEDKIEFDNDGKLIRITSSDFHGKTITFSPDGLKFVYSNGDGVRIYSATTGKLLCLLPDVGIWSSVFTLDSKYLVSLDDFGEIRKWNLEDGDFTILQPAGESRLSWTISTKGLVFTDDGSKMAVWVDTYPSIQAFKVFDVFTGKVLTEIPNSSSPEANTITISPDGKYLAIGSDQNLWVIEIETQKVLYIAEESKRIGFIQFSPDGKRIYASDWRDGEISIYDAKTGKKLKKINTCTECYGLDAYIRFALSKSGDLIATINQYTQVMVWDTKTFSLLLTFKPEQGAIYDIAMSEDGSKVAARVIVYPDNNRTEESIYFWYLK